MRSAIVHFCLLLIPAVPGFAQGGGPSEPVKALGMSDVAPAATVVPERLAEELLNHQYRAVCGTPSWHRPGIFPDGRTYGQTSVGRLQRAWRDGRLPKPDPKMPQNSAQGAQPGSRR